MHATSPAAPGADAVGGIDLGGTKIETVVTDSAHRVLATARHPTPTSGGPADIAAAMAAAMTEAARSAGLETSALRGVGVGSPGVVDSDAGTVTRADNLPGWSATFPLAATLQSALGTTVKVGNDVSVATNGEFRLGAGKPYSSLVGVFWGTGVGGGLVFNREPWHGRGAAGEIGHMVIVEDGRQCPCGRKGCVEAYAGRGALEAHARSLHAKGEKTKLFELAEEHGRDRLTSSIWARALEHGDKLTIKLLDRAVLALGAGIASAVNLLDVEAVIIGGGLGLRFGEPFRARIADAMLPHLFNDTRPPVVELAALGDQGGAIGASLLIDP